MEDGKTNRKSRETIIMLFPFPYSSESGLSRKLTRFWRTWPESDRLRPLAWTCSSSRWEQVSREAAEMWRPLTSSCSASSSPEAHNERMLSSYICRHHYCVTVQTGTPWTSARFGWDKGTRLWVHVAPAAPRKFLSPWQQIKCYTVLNLAKWCLADIPGLGGALRVNILSRFMCVTIDGVWIGEWIDWPHVHSTQNYA
jgi:hypothetical protein